jgi:hypothetical protein
MLSVMRLSWLGVVAALLICVQTQGCSSANDAYMSPARSRAMTTHITAGMPREDVVVLLGQPAKQQVVGKTELLTYQPDWSLMDASAYNPIAIQDGKVVGRGLTYAAKIELEAKQQ